MEQRELCHFLMCLVHKIRHVWCILETGVAAGTTNQSGRPGISVVKRLPASATFQHNHNQPTGKKTDCSKQIEQTD
jgi:hypothetical protein